MSEKEFIEIMKNFEPLQIPKIKKKQKRSCGNCMDLIVCFAYGELDDIDEEKMDEKTVKAKYEEKAKNCPNWHLDFMAYQEMQSTTDSEQ